MIYHKKKLFTIYYIEYITDQPADQPADRPTDRPGALKVTLNILGWWRLRAPPAGRPVGRLAGRHAGR